MGKNGYLQSSSKITSFASDNRDYVRSIIPSLGPKCFAIAPMIEDRKVVTYYGEYAEPKKTGFTSIYCEMAFAIRRLG